MRGEVYRVKSPRGTLGPEQRGDRFAVVVQSDLLPLSTWLIVPTSTSAGWAHWRPEVEVDGRETRVLCEQVYAADPSRLADRVGFLQFGEMQRVSEALRTVFDLA